jgi:nickel transport protein
VSRRSGHVLGGFVVAGWLVLVIPAVAHAHALGAEAKLKDGKVTVEAFYDDDTPATDAKVVVTDSDGKLVAEGKTDKVGKWSFSAPPAGKYKVVVDAGAGHRATVTLTVPESPRPVQPETAGRPAPGSPVASVGGEEVVVSEGPTRSEFTGWRRLAWAVAGLVVIGGGTFALSRLLRAVKGRPQPEDRT